MDHHHHHHSQGQASSHLHDYADANKEHFNTTAHTYDARPGAEELARRVVKGMKERYPELFDEDKTEVMDFACGTGLISRELCPEVKSILGVDISSAMTEQYNLRAFNQGLAPDEMRAVCQELRAADGELSGAKFDVIVCASSYHHFSSIEDVTKTIAFFLKPGGSLLVADIAKGTDHGQLFPESAHHLVAHKHGLDEDDMQRVFKKAGLIDFAFTSLTAATFHGKRVSVFLARGDKPTY